MARRLTYYSARVYGEQLNEGNHYTSLRPAISICVLTKALFPGTPDLHLDFQLRTPSGLSLTDDLQIHLLELSKLDITAHNVAAASAIEQWAFFMLTADQLTIEDVRRLFPDGEFTEAAGVLEIISKNPEQQQLYDARLKVQLDEAARLELARDEGVREGEARGLREGEARGRRDGELLGQIKLLLQLVGVTEPTPDELSGYDHAQLTELAEQLQCQLRNRGQ